MVPLPWQRATPDQRSRARRQQADRDAGRDRDGHHRQHPLRHAMGHGEAARHVQDAGDDPPAKPSGSASTAATQASPRADQPMARSVRDSPARSRAASHPRSPTVPTASATMTATATQSATLVRHAPGWPGTGCLSQAQCTASCRLKAIPAPATSVPLSRVRDTLPAVPAPSPVIARTGHHAPATIIPNAPGMLASRQPNSGEPADQPLPSSA